MAQHRRFRLQAEVANAHLKSAIQVDDQAFRTQQDEDAMELLSKMAETEKKLPLSLKRVQWGYKGWRAVTVACWTSLLKSVALRLIRRDLD